MDSSDPASTLCASPTLAVPVTKLPKIKALRGELDYGDPSSARGLAFISDINAFRRKFKTTVDHLKERGKKLHGVDLHDWKDPDTHLGLNEMVTAYLEIQGSGQLFWPDDASSKNYNKYQFTKDYGRYVPSPPYSHVFCP